MRGYSLPDADAAFETTAQIAVFVAGPLIAAAGLALAGPEAPLLASAVLVAGFGLRFARIAEAVPDLEHPRARGLGVIRRGGMRTLVLAIVLADAALGIVGVAVIAFATERGEEAAAGVLLALNTAGAVAGGTVYGARRWETPPMRRLPAVLAAFAGALLALSFAESFAVLAVLLVVAGAPSAAQWATTTSVALDDVTPAGQGAEAATWLSSVNAAEIALGGVTAGVLVEREGTAAAFAGAAGLAAAAALVVLVRRP